MAENRKGKSVSWRQPQKYQQPEMLPKVPRCERCYWTGPGRRRDRDPDYVKIRTRSLFEGGPSTLEKPSVVGSFSVDSENMIHFDNSMMPKLSKKYIPSEKSMQVELDLIRGVDNLNGYTGTTAEGFEKFLHWIIENQNELLAEDSSNKLMADFICSRGVLKAIMQAPYEARRDRIEMTIIAQYFKGSVYMKFQYEEFERKRTKKNSSSNEIYGQKFEQYMTGGDPDEVLECNCQFRCIMKQHLNELTLLYTTHVDAVDESLYQQDFKDLSSTVRLKVRSELASNDNYKKFVLNEWWNESQLSGIPRVLMGTHSDGIVHTLQMLEAAEIPDMVEKTWEPSVCINFLVKFLHFVKYKVVCEPHRVHRFQRSLFKCHIRHSHDTSVTDILPKWYTVQLFNGDNTDWSNA